jgi:3-deoxy-manno-octulosonate cytidylyltransferase (CMP-KDO synthetase)
MIEHVYRRASEARGVDATVVATDDQRIADAVTGFGGVVRMTSRVHRTGTDRLAEVARDLPCDIIVNVQGDEPLIDPETIARVVAPLRADVTREMTTACCAIHDASDYNDSHVVKVVRDVNGDALYFSRAPVPYAAHRSPTGAGQYDSSGDSEDAVPGFSRTDLPIFKHLGIYAYRRDVLLRLAALPQTPLELAESLEQLRALEHGIRIHTVETRDDSIGVDTPEDLERARARLQAMRASEVA